MFEAIQKHVDAAKHIVVLQADNPDGDSIGSALALEAIFTELGKTVTLCCAVDMPAHLRYLEGWDRVTKEIPQQFDMSIVVDTSTESLFEYYEKQQSFSWIKAKPVVVIDHHVETEGLSYATETFNLDAVATSEIIHDIAVQLGWPLPVDACEFMAISIMSDSMGLVTEATTAHSIEVVADLVKRGVSLAKLENARRELMRKEKVLVPYKGKLLQRVHFDETGRIASVTIPWEEIEEFSPLYNPSMLVIDDMRLTVGVDVAIAYKVYKDGKITAKIRCNYGRPIASDLGAFFGGGGHPYASGFKIMERKSLSELHSQVVIKANELLDKLEPEA
jgi:phosphoesterase RecJ-like protein